MFTFFGPAKLLSEKICIFMYFQATKLAFLVVRLLRYCTQTSFPILRVWLLTSWAWGENSADSILILRYSLWKGTTVHFLYVSEDLEHARGKWVGLEVWKSFFIHFSFNEDRFIFLLIHTLAASRSLYAPCSCCRFCFDDPALVLPTSEDERVFSSSGLCFLFKGGLISKIEGMALYFRRAFIFKPIDFVRTDYSSKESAVKWMLYRRLEFVGFTKADRVFFTARLHNLVKLGSPGHLWRLTPSLRVSEHPPATHRCGIFVFLGRVFDSEEVPVLLFIEISTEVEWVLPSTSLSLVG